MQACEVQQAMTVGVQALHQPSMKKHCTLVTMPMDFITSKNEIYGVLRMNDLIHMK